MKGQILLINKPPGPTSFEIVEKIRQITGVKKVGHTGTLDPFAQGLLIILVGREMTKKQQEFLKLPKTYRAIFILGKETNTFDETGKITHTFSITHIPSLEEVQNALKKFDGEFLQVPPQFSAVKIKGKVAYKEARKGHQLELPPKRVKVYKLQILRYSWPELELEMTVSSGFYVRALARDLGKLLKTGAYVEKLIRTRIGKYSLKDALELKDIKGE